VVGNRACDSNPALVSQRSDDQTGGCTQILITVVHGGGYLPHNAGVVVFNVVFKLLLPCEIMDGLNIGVDQVHYDVPVVDVGSNEGNSHFVIQRLKIASNELC
jgi:hypothetical protein